MPTARQKRLIRAAKKKAAAKAKANAKARAARAAKTSRTVRRNVARPILHGKVIRKHKNLGPPAKRAKLLKTNAVKQGCRKCGRTLRFLHL